MWAGERRLQRIFADRAGLRVHPTELVGELTAPPDRAVARTERIVRARALGWNIPELDLDLHRAFDDRRFWPLSLGEILDEIVSHRAPLHGGDRRVHVLHHAHHRKPSLGQKANAHPKKNEATVAGVDEALLAWPLR